MKEEEAPLSEHVSTRPRISEETKAAVINADPSIPGYKLARQLGISDYSVNKIRRQAGIMSAARGGRRTTKPASGDSPIMAHPEKLRESLDGLPPFPRFPLPQRPGEITVTICSAITEERALAIFARFTPVLKAIALQAGLTAAMEEA